MDNQSRDEAFAPLEMRRSTRGGTLRKTGTIDKKSTIVGSATLGRRPPRPAPSSIAYSDDEDTDSVKGYDENPDESDVTEKPTDISSTDSQVYIYMMQVYITGQKVNF